MKRQTRRKITPLLFLTILSGILVLANLTIVGLEYLLEQRTFELDYLIDDLEENLEQLKQIDAERLSNLREEATSVEEKLQLLERSFPELGAPIELYAISFELADESQIKIQSIAKVEETLEETAFGLVTSGQYSLELEGGIDSCILLIKRLERAGMDTLSIENIQLNQELQTCRFDVLTMGEAGHFEQ
jgi:hypothetical protein